MSILLYPYISFRSYIQQLLIPFPNIFKYPCMYYVCMYVPYVKVKIFCFQLWLCLVFCHIKMAILITEVRTYYSNPEDGIVLLMLEYMDGGSLQDIGIRNSLYIHTIYIQYITLFI